MKVYYLIFIGLVLAMGTANAGLPCTQNHQITLVGNTTMDIETGAVMFGLGANNTHFIIGKSVSTTILGVTKAGANTANITTNPLSPRGVYNNGTHMIDVDSDGTLELRTAAGALVSTTETGKTAAYAMFNQTHAWIADAGVAQNNLHKFIRNSTNQYEYVDTTTQSIPRVRGIAVTGDFIYMINNSGGRMKLYIFNKDMTDTGVTYNLTNNTADLTRGLWINTTHLYTADLWNSALIRTYTLSYTETCPYINLTFDQATNVTVIWGSSVSNHGATNSLYNASRNYSIGTITVKFGNNQIMEFYNDNTTSIQENLTLGSGGTTIQQIGYLWAQNKQISNERIRMYTPINNSFKLYQSVMSGTDGYFAVNVEDGLYLFVVNRSGYDYYAQLKPTSSTNTMYIYLNNGTEGTNKITISTNCPLKTPSDTTCYLYTDSLRAGTVVRYLYYINDTWQTPQSGTTTSTSKRVQLTVTVNSAYYRWNITTEVDGINITSMTTEWENLTNRSVQINIPTTPVLREDLPLVALIIMITAATIAAIINQYAPGTGIYTYGIILAGWTGFSGIFWVPATIAGFFLAINVAKRIVG